MSNFVRDVFEVLIQELNFFGRDAASVSEAPTPPVEVLPYAFSLGGSTGEGTPSISTKF